MKFKEAIEIIEEKCGIEDENPFLNKERDLDPFLALYIIKNLKETYAPKIKMTGKELDFLNSRFKTNESSGSKVFIDANGRKIEISHRNLQAWLHPELIEVTDE